MSRTFTLFAMLSACSVSGDIPEELVEVADEVADGGFEVALDDVVFARLRSYEGDRSEFLSAALARRVQFEPMISDKIAKADLPAEIIAVVLVESGFLNIPRKPCRRAWLPRTG